MLKQASTRSSPGKIPAGYAVEQSKFLTQNNVIGDGLYTLLNIEAGHFIGEYKGKRLTVDQAAKKKTKRNYFFDVKGKKKQVLFVIDAADTRASSFLRYVNAANARDEQNATFVQKNRKIYLKALRDIRAGEEILTWYGASTRDLINQK